MQAVALACTTAAPAPLARCGGAQAARSRCRLPSRPFRSQQQQRRVARLEVIAMAVKVVKAKQVLCNKTLRCKEGQAEAVLALAAPLVEWSREVMKDRSSGLKSFEVSQDDYESTLVHFYELYDHASHLSAHNTSPKFRAFMEEVQDLLTEPIGMIMYEYRDGQIGAPCLEGGPKGEGGLDDATGASKMGGGASFKQTSGVVDLTQVVEDDDEEKGLWGIKLPWQK